MKRIISLILLLILSFSLCLFTAAETEETPSSSETVSETETDEAFGKSDVTAKPLYKSKDVRTLLLIFSGAVVFFIFAGVCIHRLNREISPSVPKKPSEEKDEADN